MSDPNAVIEPDLLGHATGLSPDAHLGNDMNHVLAGVETLNTRADELLAVAQRAATTAHARGDEIDAMLTKIRRIRTEMATA
jgi:hypothetical protein